MNLEGCMCAESSLEPIVEALTRRIALGDYAAGQRLPTETELQKEWRVSRSVVREAMKILASQGLVSIQQGRGTFVNEANHAALQNHLEMTLKRAGKNGKPSRAGDEFDYLMDVRRVLEVAVAERAAAAASEDDILDMESTIGAMRDNADDAAACADADLLFHRVLARAAGNPLWPAVLDGLNGLLRQLQEIGHHGRENALMTADEHERILDAIRARQATAAIEAMRAHLDTTGKDLLLARRKGRK
jgi:GntR family transcriptional repressor for pyruvate dehydrogenase complex